MTRSVPFCFRVARLALGAVLLAWLSFASDASAQTLEQEFQLRMIADVEKKLAKQWSVVVSPEVRTVGMNPDRYLVEVGAKYDPFDYLSVRPGFRFDVEEKNSGLEGGYRARMDVVGKYEWENFEPNARLRYTFGFSPVRPSEHVLRYKLGLDYEIKKADVTLGASAEAFHDLGAGSVYKMRYGGGAEWEFYKTKKLDQGAGVEYYFEYFLDRYKNVHIVELTYSIQF